MTNILDRSRSIEYMAEQIFVSSSKFSAQVMTLDKRNTQQKGGVAKSTPAGQLRKSWCARTYLPHFMRRVVYTSNFSYLATLFAT